MPSQKSPLKEGLRPAVHLKGDEYINILESVTICAQRWELTE